MIEIKKSGIDSLPVIAALAKKIWPVAYKDITPIDQINYMLELFYSDSSLLNQVTTLGHQFILVTDENTPIGFASYSVKSSEEPTIYRLHKLYVDCIYQGKGIGKMLIDFIVTDIKKENGTYLELNVNRENIAKEFYSKLGFIITKEEDRDIGNNFFMNDYVMKLELT
jgi:diamine N-acetyltransferase